KYPRGTAARYACDTFNYAYTSLLKTLHAMFNGQPGQLDSAIGLMMSLKQLARDMMSGSNPVGVNVGPSFEYQPIEPWRGTSRRSRSSPYPGRSSRVTAARGPLEIEVGEHRGGLALLPGRGPGLAAGECIELSAEPGAHPGMGRLALERMVKL